MSGLAISDYRLGDLIGRGASGSVYRGINFKTGETVAIKSISLSALSPSSLPDIMSEIDLLKNLNHPNIVKYKGFEQDANSLHIILEYCENGSLQTILKKFGKFPESLVAVYITQVLEGLIYLHEQGVIHRDIKGANILTDKKGSVKLADFGVAAGPTALDDAGRNDNEVVGSPYWMAPEVIEQNGSSTASDIWSVGCVVVELLEGQPPHGELAPMQAMWRIVQDESMRVPEGASPIVKDFLYHCFQKDPNIRVTAKKLLKHPWILATRNEAGDSEGTPSPPASSPAPEPSGITLAPPAVPQVDNRSPSRFPASNSGGSDTVRAKKKPSTVYDEAVSRVREWNEALNASPSKINTMQRNPDDVRKPTGSSRPRPAKSRTGAKQLINLFTNPGMPSRSSADSISAEPSSSAGPSPIRPLIASNFHVQDALSRIKEEDSRGGIWDADFASDITMAQIQSQEVSQNTLKPARYVPPDFPTTPAKAGSSSRAGNTSLVEDYSDMAFDEDEPELEAKMAHLKNRSQRGILHPNDISKMKPPAKQRPTIPSSRPLPVSTHSSPILHTSSDSPFSPLPYGRSAPGSRANSVRSRTESDNLPELNKYTEDEDEDYSDILDKPSLGVSKKLQLTKRSFTPSFDDDAAEMDPFAEIDDSFDVEDFETKLFRDKRATQCAHIDKLVDQLVPSAPSAALQTTCDELLALLDDASEQLGLESHFVSSHGLLAVLEMLEVTRRDTTAAGLLKIVNMIVMRDLDALESFCLVGGIQVIIPYTSKRHSPETRLEAAHFIQQLTQSPLTMQMFISCRGLRILVEMLDEDYSVNCTLILSSLDGIGAVFDLQSPTPRNDFCRMFVREGILDPLSSSILSILRDESLGIAHESTTRAINILLLFSQVSQADSRVREAFASRTIVIRLLKACEKLQDLRDAMKTSLMPHQEKLLATALKSIKHLAASPQLIEVLQNSNAIECLVSLLGKTMKEDNKVETSSHIFQTIWSMTKLSKARQEEAASAGIIPLLKKVIKGTSRLDQFALPIFCELANAGKVSRRLLWKNDGLQLYLKLLGDPYWRGQALDAILVWMQDETARVEDALLDHDATAAIMNCFVQSSGSHLEKVIDSLLKVLRLSAYLVTAISQPPLLEHLCTFLSRPLRAVIKLNVLRLTKILFENHSNATDLARFGIREVVEKLSRQDEAVLVRELAKEILPALPHLPKAKEPERYSSTGPTQFFSRSTSQRHRDPGSSSSRSSIPSTSSGRSMPPPPVPSSSSTSESRGRIPELFRRVTPTSKLAIKSPRPDRERQKTDPGQTSISMVMENSISSSSSRGGSAREPLRPSLERSESSEVRKHKRTVSRSVKDVTWQADENGILRTVRKAPK